MAACFPALAVAAARRRRRLVSVCTGRRRR
ncbi:hypothetical protein ACFFIZ_11765 [Paracoccus rhizosphaerae]|uniref:Uncharacterized protein n=1 Tax=Paracoccus rhizosphaerae TaxID=1133347 RepID=A0ABV6CJP6_9RHOB